MKKFEIFCNKCNSPVGYTDHEFKTGDALNAHLVILPTGEQAKPGDAIVCKCDVVSTLHLRIRTNKKK